MNRSWELRYAQLSVQVYAAKGKDNMRQGSLRSLIGLAAIAFIAVGSFQLRTDAAGEAGLSGASSPTFLTQLKLKFDGANSCASEKCHGAAKAANNGNMWGNECTLWRGKDSHHKAYRTLITPPAKEIATKLKIAAATKSERCLNCHTTFAPAPLQGKDYSAVEGVSCGSCHGPSDKWLEPHSKQGWANQQRAKFNTDQLLRETGLLDTKPVPQRAQRCTSCHLAIDTDLVAAGHPQPTFEMNYFSSLYLDKYDRHWHDPAGTFPATLWASGQVVELHDAMAQVAQHASAKDAGASDVLNNSFKQAMAHYEVFKTLFTAGAVAGDTSKLDADVKKLSDAVAGKDNAGAATAAAAAAEDANALTETVGKFKPDAGSLKKMMGAVGGADMAKAYGPRGEEQQAYALLAFAQASGNKALESSLKPLLPTKPGDPPKPEDYAKALANVQKDLMK